LAPLPAAAADSEAHEPLGARSGHMNKDAEASILRRAEVSRLARRLKTRLGVAMDTIEPRVAADARSPRTAPGTHPSDATPPRNSEEAGSLANPFTTPIVTPTSNHRRRDQRNGRGYASGDEAAMSGVQRRKRARTMSSNKTTASRTALGAKGATALDHHGMYNRLLQSSPIYPASYSGGYDAPKTPPPRHHASSRHPPRSGEEGADLLLYLATSPSPATGSAASMGRFATVTPPPKLSERECSRPA